MIVNLHHQARLAWYQQSYSVGKKAAAKTGRPTAQQATDGQPYLGPAETRIPRLAIHAVELCRVAVLIDEHEHVMDFLLGSGESLHRLHVAGLIDRADDKAAVSVLGALGRLVFRHTQHLVR